MFRRKYLKNIVSLHLIWRIYMKKIVSFLLILLAFDISSNAQNVDLSSVDEFLNITALLKNGEEVNMEQWNQLDISAAYSIFSNSKDNTIPNIVKAVMLDVFGCSGGKGQTQNGSLLETSVRANYEDIKKNYSEIRKFRDNYDFESLISNAKFRLQTFLGCEQLDASVKWKPVYFFFLSQDGKELDNAIVLDFNLIYRMTEEERINFLAHEFFHVYRAHFEHHEFNYANDINFAIDMIANEGIADQIDKYMGYDQYFSNFSKSKELASEFKRLYNNAPKDIKYLQTTIAQYAANQIDKDTCIDRLISIYKYNGHALGFYMSNQIIKAGLRDEMIKEFHNPYEFFRLYSLALPKDEKASLNDDFLLFLKAETEQYY